MTTIGIRLGRNAWNVFVEVRIAEDGSERVMNTKMNQVDLPRRRQHQRLTMEHLARQPKSRSLFMYQELMRMDIKPKSSEWKYLVIKSSIGLVL
jgi:hypothetical protein